MVANDGSTAIYSKDFIYSNLAGGDGNGRWPKMGLRIELEPCFKPIRDTA